MPSCYPELADSLYDTEYMIIGEPQQDSHSHRAGLAAVRINQAARDRWMQLIEQRVGGSRSPSRDGASLVDIPRRDVHFPESRGVATN
jgi:hypothetical protein